MNIFNKYLKIMYFLFYLFIVFVGCNKDETLLSGDHQYPETAIGEINEKPGGV
jgi:hypothetical protein